MSRRRTCGSCSAPGDTYIAGEKLQGRKAAVEAALRRPGRYQPVRDNLEVKEIVVGEGSSRIRYILVRNPQEAERDRKQREEILVRLRKELAALPAGPSKEHTRAACALLSHPTYRRYLRTDAHGRPQIDPDKVRNEARLDGKYLVRT